jgi:hypothetical protein
MMTARSDAGTGSGLQVGSFFKIEQFSTEIEQARLGWRVLWCGVQ